MTERHNRRELGRRLSVSWSPALAARVRRRLDATIVTRRRRRRALILALGLLAMGGASYAFSYAWRIPRLETTPAPLRRAPRRRRCGRRTRPPAIRRARRRPGHPPSHRDHSPRRRPRAPPASRRRSMHCSLQRMQLACKVALATRWRR